MSTDFATKVKYHIKDNLQIFYKESFADYLP